LFNEKKSFGMNPNNNSRIIRADAWDKSMADAFTPAEGIGNFSNYYSSGSEFDNMSEKFTGATTITPEYLNLFGSHKRKKACKDSGLTGKEKRACAKQLKQAGWKKGQPIPPDITPASDTGELSEAVETPLTNADPLGLTKKTGGDTTAPTSEKTPADLIEKKDAANTSAGFLSKLSSTEKMLMIGGAVVIVGGLLIYGMSGSGKVSQKSVSNM
jgi:hypothetical protein